MHRFRYLFQSLILPSTLQIPSLQLFNHSRAAGRNNPVSVLRPDPSKILYPGRGPDQLCSEPHPLADCNGDIPGLRSLHHLSPQSSHRRLLSIHSDADRRRHQHQPRIPARNSRAHGSVRILDRLLRRSAVSGGICNAAVEDQKCMSGVSQRDVLSDSFWGT